MFILTGWSGPYYEASFAAIAISEDRAKLEKMILHIREAANLCHLRSKINLEYRVANAYRVNAVPQEPLLSKDHLPLSAGDARFQINQKNTEIKQRNSAKRTDVDLQVQSEANELARKEVPMSPEQEKLLKFVYNEYDIDEIVIVR